VNWRKTLLIVEIIVGALGLLVALEFLRAGGTFTSLPGATGQHCRAIEIAGAAPDIAIDSRRGIAYLALLDRATPVAAGTVQLLDLHLADPAPRAAMNFDPGNFSPDAVSLLDGSPRQLFASSTLPDGTRTVEIAAEAPSGGFSPELTVRDPAFRELGALVAVGPKRFYAATGRHGRYDAVLRRAPDSLLYYDGSNTRVVDRGLRHVGGLAISPDGARLYVAETLAQALRVYAVKADGAIELSNVIWLPYPPARITVDEDGGVWIAAWPKLYKAWSRARGRERDVATVVLRVDPRTPEREAVVVYSGAEMSAGSVAARWRDTLLIGASFDGKVLVCKLNP
jgi:hypothetical protein